VSRTAARSHIFMDKQKIIDKIHKCLRLADSGNPNEAALALRQAQAMMRKYKIREEEVRAYQINEASANSAGYYNPPYWAIALSELVAEAFDCRAYITRQDEQRPYFRFIGVNYAAAVAAYTFTVLFRQLRLARRHYMEELIIEDKQEKLRQGNVFAQAWLFRIAKTVAEFVNDDQAQAMVDDYVKQHYGETLDFMREPTAPASEDYNVILSGLRAADAVQLFRPMDESTRTKGLVGKCA
jgi:hypothetical protein